jgi:hypothetical protein
MITLPDDLMTDTNDTQAELTACSPSYFTFRNKDGQTIQLRGDLTMEDLIRMGYPDIRLVQPEKPLAPHEWRADPISLENVQDHTTPTDPKP